MPPQMPFVQGNVFKNLATMFALVIGDCFQMKNLNVVLEGGIGLKISVAVAKSARVNVSILVVDFFHVGS